MRYFLIGFMGSGKSYWGKKWSEVSKLPHIDLDAEIEKAEGRSIKQIFDEEGEEAFRKIERKVLRSFLKKDNYIMSCGGGTPCYYDNLRRMNHRGITIYLKSSAETLARRLRDEKEARPLIKDVPDELLVDFIRQKLDVRRDYYTQCIYHLDTEFLDNENFQRIIRRHGA
jgi:shikimate kinase